METKGAIMQDKTPRRRFMYRFWLDVNKPDQRALAEALEAVKARRKFAPTVRDALRLFLDLQDGNTGELCRLFPDLVAESAPSRRVSLPTRDGNPDGDADLIQVEESAADSDAVASNFLSSVMGLQ
jgi:hypothetical protein